MSSIQNKVNIKQNGETVRSLTQNVSMSGDLNGKNGTLMNFIGSFPSADGNSSSLEQKSIFSLVKDENTIKVQIKLPGIFKDKNGASLSENSEIVKDYVLLEDGKNFWLEDEYIDTEHINGTGDTYSACIAAELAKGASVEEAIRISKKYTHDAIKNEIAVGHKFGPINHWV